MQGPLARIEHLAASRSIPHARKRSDMRMPYKVYAEDGEFLASCRYVIDAATIIGAIGAGTIRFEHRRVVWREGSEDFSAAESYDGVEAIIRDRIEHTKE